MAQPTNRALLEHIHQLLHHDAHGLAAILANQRHIHKELRNLMTVADDIKAALAEVSATVTAEPDLLTAIGTKMDGLSAQITALEQQIADLQNNSGALSPADVAEVQASLAALKDATNANKAKEEILANTTATPTP